MFGELVRKDLKLFIADKRGMIVSIAVPIALASFMALIFGGAGGGGGGGAKMNAVPLAIVDHDQSELSKALVKDLATSGLVEPKPMRQDEAMGDVKLARIAAAMILPEGFAKQSTAALFSGDPPRVQLIFDPSKSAEVQIVRGAMMQSAMKVVTKEAFSPANWRATSRENLARIEQSTGVSAEQKAILRALFASLDPVFARLNEMPATRDSSGQSPAAMGGMRTPFALQEQPMTAGNPDGQRVRRASVSHCFVGMTVQGVLFFAIEAAMGLLRERNQGIWRRLRASPLSRMTLLSARAASGSMIGLIIIAAVLLFGAAFFGLRVSGSALGFVLICLATAAMAATLGLLIATLGRSEQQSRGIAIFAILVMVMLSGAWMPAFMMPKLMQQVGVVLPSRWAVEGLDGTTWRGWGFANAIGPSLALLGFAALFVAIAWKRFRWEGD